MDGKSRYGWGKFAPQLEAAVCAALVVLFLWKGVLPAWRTLNTDFPNYYLVARLWREGYRLDRIYDWTWLQRIKDHWGLNQSLVGFAGLTPLSAFPVVPLTFFSALTAKRIWIVINLGLLAASVELLERSTALGRRRIWLIALLAVLPLRTSFLYGQMHLAVLFLMVLAFYFHQRHREIACGVSIALAGALKVYPLAFVLYFLWKRQARAAVATLGAALAIGIAGGVAMGWEVQRIYLFEMLPRSLQGEVLDPYSAHAAAGAGILHRLLLFEPALNPSPAFSSSALYAVVYPLWQLAILLPLLALLYPASRESGREQVEWGAFLLALLLLSPVPSTYHFVVMILCAVLLIDSLVRESRWVLAGSALLLYFFACVADFLHLFLHRDSGIYWLLGISRLWFGTALFVLFLVSLYRSRPPETGARTKARMAMLAGFAAIVLTTGIVGYRHHFLHREQEMSLRIAPSANALLATLPQLDAGGFAFVAMERVGYRVAHLGGVARGASELVFKSKEGKEDKADEGDELSFALAADRSLYVEVADTSGSRVLRAADRTVVARDAESPAISWDGRQLAFLRERKGLGSLWIVPLAGDPGKAARLTGEDYDVRGLSFLRSGALLFLARHDGRTVLYTVARGGTPALFFSPETEIASFAVSPDERRITLTELIGHRWQLAVWEVSSRRVSVLTSTDCNAYTPAWTSPSAIVYGTDCGRGVGLTALASLDVPSSEP